MNTFKEVIMQDQINYHLDKGELHELGMKRLGRVIELSLKIQGLSYRQFKLCCENLFSVGIGINNIGALIKGQTLNPTDHTLRRLTPFLFRVEQFENDEGSRDEIGRPILTIPSYINYKNDDTRKNKLENATSVFHLPDLDYRYRDLRELNEIIELKSPVKTIFNKAVN